MGKRGAVAGEEKWVTEEEVVELLDSAAATGFASKTALQLRAMLARHRHWEATVRIAVVGASRPVAQPEQRSCFELQSRQLARRLHSTESCGLQTHARSSFCAAYAMSSAAPADLQHRHDPKVFLI